VEILANCIIEDAVIGQGSRIGPYARLRPDSVLANDVHIGNFVEIKKSTVAAGSKINHLSYIGDATVGSKVNIGAGTITCNYDGVNKFRTTIEDGAFIGSNSQLVAPVTIGKNATIGAGSTITKDSPENQLTLSRAKQITVTGWQRPGKKEKYMWNSCGEAQRNVVNLLEGLKRLNIAADWQDYRLMTRKYTEKRELGK
jgi:bifunctional UDP-N-acetylglucosamine pyrophosphorylase/glucosamine-1-phosphate N-acetyltransferase